MRVNTFSVLFIVIAIFFIMSIVVEIFLDDFIKPNSLFIYLFLGSLISTIAGLAININVPD